MPKGTEKVPMSLDAHLQTQLIRRGFDQTAETMDKMAEASASNTESKKLQCNRLRVSHTTTFIFDDGEFFCAHTDMPGVRIGMNGITAFNIPKGHAFYDRTVEADTRASVEALFDELMDAFNSEEG